MRDDANTIAFVFVPIALLIFIGIASALTLAFYASVEPIIRAIATII